MIRQCYSQAYGARLDPLFGCYLRHGESPARGAALGFERAGPDPLFLERYLDAPVETLVSVALGRGIARERIVEIGNFASGNAMAMVALWGIVVNDLAGSSEVACATLTAPLRAMFARIGVPIVALAPARAERAGTDVGRWGTYYRLDPQVCCGEIAAGQRAISRFLARRSSAGRRAA
jgi:hypothetical protein